MENNESFASHKEETPIINQLEETIVEWLKSGDENATNLAYQIFFKHIERKETPASKEKPDFEKMAKQFVAHHVRPGKGYIGEVIFENMLPGIVEHTKRTMEFIYKAEVVPYQEQIAALQEEIRQLKEGMGGVVNWIQKVGVDNAIRGSVIIEMIEELKNKQ